MVAQQCHHPVTPPTPPQAPRPSLSSKPITCCIRCNQIKGNMSGDEFLRLLALLNDFNPAARQSVLSRLRAGGRILHR